MKYSVFFPLVAALGLAAISARGGELTYSARCDLSQPLVAISFDRDLRSLMGCHEKEGNAYLSPTQAVQMTIGSQRYAIKSQWLSGSTNCKSALAAFEQFPMAYFMDGEVERTMVVNFSRDYKALSVTIGLRRDACVGKSGG